MRRSRFARKRQNLNAEINVVPYIDVMLVLLIIFMITAPIVQQGVTVDLPKTPANKTISAPNASNLPLVVEVSKNGLMYLQGYDQVHTENVQLMSQTLMALHQSQPDRPVYIQGDRLAPYGQIVSLFVTLKNLGYTQVQLMTQPEVEN